MATDAQTIIDVIAEEVQHLGFSKVARLSGYERGSLYHVFGEGRTTHTPNIRMLCDIAEAVGMTIEVRRK